MIDVDTIFAADRENPPAERTLPWEEHHDGITVVVEPKPHWASDLYAWRLTSREFCYYADWTANGSAARFIPHIETTGDHVMMKARALIAREIADGFYRD